MCVCVCFIDIDRLILRNWLTRLWRLACAKSVGQAGRLITSELYQLPQMKDYRYSGKAPWGRWH